jgi:hypothetical protein
VLRGVEGSVAVALESDFVDTTFTATVHAAHHNALATASNVGAAVFTPEAYGAKGDGTTDDTAAVLACAAAANAKLLSGVAAGLYQPGATVVFQGSYNLASLATPVILSCNVQSSGAQLIVPDSYAGVAVLVGHPTSGSILMSAHIDMPDVIKPGTTITTGASLVAGSIGVRVQNLYSSQFLGGRILYFETGLDFSGLGNGTAYNQIHTGYVSYAKVSVQLKPQTGGWVNQNVITGGGLQQSVSWAGGTRVSGWRGLVLDGGAINVISGNTFYGFSIEGNASEYAIYCKSAYQNTFYGLRFEQGATAVSCTVSGDTITASAHGLSVNDMLMLEGTTAPAGGVLGTPYYVVTVTDSNNFKIAQGKGAPTITFTSAGTAVSYLRPARVYMDNSGSYGNLLNKVIHPTIPVNGLDLVSSTTAAAGNIVLYDVFEIFDRYSPEDLPYLRLRNTSSAATSRALIATYGTGINPQDDPRNWSIALSDRGLLFGASRAELSCLTSATGPLQYRRPADSQYFEIPSGVRMQSGTTFATGTTVNANSRNTGTVTLTGASVSDYVQVSTNVLPPIGLRIYAVVTSANTVTWVVENTSGANITTAADISMYFMTSRRFY